jgi:hypothetical protein
MGAVLPLRLFLDLSQNTDPRPPLRTPASNPDPRRQGVRPPPGAPRRDGSRMGSGMAPANATPGGAASDAAAAPIPCILRSSSRSNRGPGCRGRGPRSARREPDTDDMAGARSWCRLGEWDGLRRCDDRHVGKKLCKMSLRIPSKRKGRVGRPGPIRAPSPLTVASRTDLSLPDVVRGAPHINLTTASIRARPRAEVE